MAQRSTGRCRVPLRPWRVEVGARNARAHLHIRELRWWRVARGVHHDILVALSMGKLLRAAYTAEEAIEYVQSPALLAAASSGAGIPFFPNMPPSAAMVVWGLLHPLVILVGAVASFQRRDL